MAAILSERDRRRWDDQGVRRLAAAEALDGLERALAGDAAHVMMAAIDWDRYVTDLRRGYRPPPRGARAAHGRARGAAGGAPGTAPASRRAPGRASERRGARSRMRAGDPGAAAAARAGRSTRSAGSRTSGSTR